MSKRTKMIRLSAAGICLLSVTNAAAQNLTVANSGFETPTTSSYIYNPAGASWTFSPQGDNVGSGVTANNSAFTSSNPAAPEGSQVAFLQNAATISQTISGFTPGGTYTISFSAANRARAGYNTPQSWDVRIDGVTKASFANAPTSYTHYTASFTATAASHTLAFVGTTSADATVFLDDLSMTLDAPITGPTITRATLSESDLVLQGTNGPSRGAYQVLRTAEVNQSVADWLDVGVAAFDAAGNFSYTNPVAPNDSAAFYRLEVISYESLPEITAQPEDRVAIVEGTASFSVTAKGMEPLHYQWYYNTNTVLADETNSTLMLTDVQLSDAGMYSVAVTNLLGSVTSDFAKLTVSTNSGSQLIGWASVPAYGTATTTGGGTATPQPVTDVATLRTLAGDSTPRVLLLSGTFVTGSTAIDVASNKTLKGADKNAKIQGGLRISGRSNIIIQNLSVQGNGYGGSPSDAIEVRGSHHLWFDHLTVWEGGDGNLDITRGCDYITVSWCRFYYTDPSHGHRLSSLVGGGSTHADTDWGKNNVTFHHNWYSTLVSSRMPRLLFGKGHFFNNYYNSPGNGYCIGTGSWASALIENNYFKQVADPHRAQDSNPSYIAASGNIYDSTSGSRATGLLNPDNNADDPGPWIPPYPYTLDAAADVLGIVTAGAGPQ